MRDNKLNKIHSIFASIMLMQKLIETIFGLGFWGDIKQFIFNLGDVGFHID